MTEKRLNSNLKVLLVMPDIKEKNYVMNYGLMYISSFLKQKGYKVQCLNMNHYDSTRLIECLEKNSFDVVGTGGLFVHYSIIKSLIETIRQHSHKSKIILGGGIASTEFEFILNNLKPDFLVVGEGEKTADLLLKAFENGTDYHKVTGISYKENNKIIKTEPTPLIEDLNELPFPDYEGFEYSHYFDNFFKADGLYANVLGANYRAGYVMSSRDCMNRCTFCFRIIGDSVKKNAYRVRTIESVLDEIRFLMQNYGINVVGFLDEMISFNKQRIIDLCKLIRPLNIKWSCQLRVNTVDYDLLKKMKESGCYMVSYGFESASQKVLRSMKKGIKPDQIYKAIKSTQRAKMDVQGNFIFGDPAETLETVRETINFTRKFKSTCLGYGFVMPLPGSKIYHDAVRKGLIKDKAAFYTSYPSGPGSVNLTSLNQCKYMYMRYKVIMEGMRRTKSALGKIVRVDKIRSNTYKTDIICPFCSDINQFTAEYDPDTMNYRSGNHIICKNCYRRIVYNYLNRAYGNKIFHSIKYFGEYYGLQLLTSSYLLYLLYHKFNMEKLVKSILISNGKRLS
jgi:anaerobic magnesium-protoporphyrin IX monomethyl ester cyclase